MTIKELSEHHNIPEAVIHDILRRGNFTAAQDKNWQNAGPHSQAILGKLSRAAVLLAEELFKHITNCATCPAADTCGYHGDDEMFGTECVGVLKTWAENGGL